ncbi:MAG: TolC family protein, partial [Bacteroidales bacterium]|nr:TolC family protein [Bacteroidales bacterium]
MKKITLLLFFISAFGLASWAQAVDTSSTPKILTLEQALQIALSENTSVKVADMEIERTGYARKGSYSALFPQISASGMFQRTLKKQVMYMDFDMGALGGGGAAPGGSGNSGNDSGSSSSGNGTATAAAAPSMDGGIEVGRWNTWNAGISASMPIVSAQLWQSLKISDQDVEIAVEKARSSRLDMVNQVKQAYFSCL